MKRTKKNNTYILKGHKLLFSVISIGFLLVTTIFACRTSDLDEFNPVMTAANERDLGNRLLQEILDKPNQYSYLNPDDYPEIYDYLATAVLMVESQTAVRDFFDWEILVLDNDNSLNAFSLPGGKILISSGLLKYLEGEHQLVALLAHEAHYINRGTDSAAGSLSLIMNKLKTTFTNTRGLGTKIFIDAIDGDDSLVGDIIETAKSASYDPSVVFKADEFAVNMICENYLYVPTGLRELLMKAQNENSIDFVWLNNKPPSLLYSKPPDFTLETRSLHLENMEMVCIDNELISNASFDAMQNMLP